MVPPRVTFSQRQEEQPLVRQIIRSLVAWGIDEQECFFQESISDSLHVQWQSQWLTAADASGVVVCLLTEKYLLSDPCVAEWMSIR